MTSGTAVVPSGRREIYGRAEYLRGVGRTGEGTRDVVVWLPAEYDEEPWRRFPVLYMHDGQNLIDPETAHIGVDWQLDDVATAMIAAGRIVPFLAVGIYSGDDRTSLLHTDAYRRFLVETVKPMIDVTFRTRSGREDTAVMGSSLGGLAAFLAAWRHPDVFAAAGCLSPYFPPGLVDEVAAGTGLDGVRLYLDNGDDDLDTSFQPEIDRMLATLRKLGFTADVDLAWHRDVGGVHDESAWAARVWRPLEFLYGPRTSSST